MPASLEPNLAELTSLEQAQTWVYAFAYEYPGIMAIARVSGLMLWGVIEEHDRWGDRRLRRGARWL